jgi:predicted PurR-regulated permease PerM
MALNPPSKRLTIWLGVAILVAFILWILGPVLVPFAVAAVLAYALHPAVLRLNQTVTFLPRVVCVVVVE